MLVLTRKPGEKIFVGEDVIVTLIAIRRDDEYGDRVRIGFQAPSHVLIRREEVKDQLQRSEQAAAESNPESLEIEAQQLSQKVKAIECQVAREVQAAPSEAQHVEALSAALVALRRRCDQLLDQLNKSSSRGSD